MIAATGIGRQSRASGISSRLGAAQPLPVPNRPVGTGIESVNQPSAALLAMWDSRYLAFTAAPKPRPQQFYAPLM